MLMASVNLVREAQAGPGAATAWRSGSTATSRPAGSRRLPRRRDLPARRTIGLGRARGDLIRSGPQVAGQLRSPTPGSSPSRPGHSARPIHANPRMGGSPYEDDDRRGGRRRQPDRAGRRGPGPADLQPQADQSAGQRPRSTRARPGSVDGRTRTPIRPGPDGRTCRGTTRRSPRRAPADGPERRPAGPAARPGRSSPTC